MSFDLVVAPVSNRAQVVAVRRDDFANFDRWFSRADVLVTKFLARHAVRILRINLGIVFLWFGALKFFHDLSPAEDLAGRTIEALSFGVVKESVSLPVLATWETAIGLGLIAGKPMRATLLLLLTQMLGTVTPVFLFPSEVFTRAPYALTLEGQYIIKNLVLISAALVLGATVRGGAIVADPEALGPRSRR